MISIYKWKKCYKVDAHIVVISNFTAGFIFVLASQNIVINEDMTHNVSSTWLLEKTNFRNGQICNFPALYKNHWPLVLVMLIIYANLCIFEKNSLSCGMSKHVYGHRKHHFFATLTYFCRVVGAIWSKIDHFQLKFGAQVKIFKTRPPPH